MLRARKNRMDIIDFAQLTAAQRGEAARVLRDAFAHVPDAFDGAFEAEVESFFTDPARAAIAVVDGEALVGWIGRVETYSHAWELHPLCVDPAHQGKGVGAALVRALEARVKAAGVLTLYLGTDDEFGGTSLFGRDLFPDVAGKIAGVTETGGHPFAFYRKLGYEIVGLMPDANGPGRPDIFMAKRL
jgi:aminoglycoside 6'-N-acetyltransferase I